ncbi:MAG: HutD family protein [Paracoccaceae bacterium]|nr:HutD family protein [Paracoccaceae bacterium]
MKIIRASDLTEVRWKNGGGVTREIAVAGAHGMTIWRLSIADVAVDGPFSDFSGLMRILTVIRGNGMDLISAQGILSADLNRPVRFDGALKINSVLKDGPIQDLNLMFDPLFCDGDVVSVEGPCRQDFDADPLLMLGVVCTKGRAEISKDMHLHPGDSALISSGNFALRLGKDASAVLVTLTDTIHQA